jgi:hypothetical protein
MAQRRGGSSRAVASAAVTANETSAPTHVGSRRNSIRRSQAITTWGPGALLDLPRHSVMVSGIDYWGGHATDERIIEPRLTGKIKEFLELDYEPLLYAPPRSAEREYDRSRQVTAWQFPEWFVVQEQDSDRQADLQLSRRLVHRRALDRGTFAKRPVVATRFVRACPVGHITDIDWRAFVHRGETVCKGQLWFDETGTTGDIIDITIKCDCTATRRLIEAMEFKDPSNPPLGPCLGWRPWLGANAPLDTCDEKATRLLNRQATNAYFGKTLSVLALPDRSAELSAAITPHLETLLAVVTTVEGMAVARRIPPVERALQQFSDQEVFEDLEGRRRKDPRVQGRPVKFVELDALLASPAGYDDTPPLDTNFHARMLPEAVWRPSQVGGASDLIERVVQVHRLREVVALLGFSRFEATTVDADGDYHGPIRAAKLALNARWYPAIENRGEGIFLQVRRGAIDAWLAQEAVRSRVDALKRGHTEWLNKRPGTKSSFRGGAYLMLHTLAHLLCQTVAVRSGYPASAIRERIYADYEAGRYGILLYTGSADADGTLGGLVQEAFRIAEYLEDALDGASICSNDPICAAHVPGDSLEERYLHGAACHGCVLIGETSCEARNDHLDRALVVPILGVKGTAFFRSTP